MSATTLHLVIPGLTGPRPIDRAPVAPALEWLLARARPHAVAADPESLLLHLFGLPVEAGGEPPVAALTRLGDGGDVDAEGWWLRADPVHLRADLHGVLLADARALAIDATEAALLAAAFDHTFATDGLQLDVPHPQRWYLRLPADPGIRTRPLAEVIGRDINALLPQGSAARRWRTLMTEVQMLFHAHPVNRAREEQQLPLLNGLWFWGGGPCPVSAQAPAAGLYARDPLARGLAHLAQAAIQPLPDDAADWRAISDDEPSSLVLLDATRYDPIDDDAPAWAARVAELERDWFAPCRQWLERGELAALHLYPGNGCCYSVSPAARWRFWRRARSLSAY